MYQKNKFQLIAFLVVLGSILLNACAPLTRVVETSEPSSPAVTPSESPNSGGQVPGKGSLQVITIAGLLDVLKSAGVPVDLVQKDDSSFLESKESWTVDVPNGELHVYVFDNKETAVSASQRIGPDGTEITGTDGSVSSVRWVGAPHFWLFENFIVQYLGDDKTILSGIETALGKQFAGMQ